MKTRLFLTLLSICAFCFGVNAQVSLYGFSATSGAFTAITGGTVVNATVPDSYVSGSLTLAPGFMFAGITYTNAYMTSNGLITLGGTTAPSTTNYNAINGATGSGIAICPFNANLIGSSATGATPGMRFETIGNEHVFQWLDVSRTPATTDRFSIQARLNITTGVITFVYDFISAGALTTLQPVIGLRTAATDYKNLIVTGPGTETWANPNIGTTLTDVVRFTTASPAKVFTSGQTYIWTPPSCPAPAASLFTVSALSYSTAVMTWTPAFNESTWIFGYAPPTTTLAVSTPSYALSGLTPSTEYTVRVRAYCGVGDTSIWVTKTIKTTCQPPVVSSALSGSLCVTGTVNLQATTASSASLRWYTVPTGGVVNSTNSSFTTPTLTNTTTYYVSARTGVGGNTGRLAPAAPFAAGNSAYSGGLYFNATSPFVLNSVDVYCVGAAATGQVRLLNSAGATIETLNIPFPAGSIANPVIFTIPLNWNIPVGNDWVIYREPAGGTVVLGGPETNITPAGTSIPLTAGSQVGEITRGYWFSAVNDYYFFYNWNIGAGCESARTPVTVTVNPRPTILALSSATGAVCAGSPVNLLVGGNATNYTWTPSGGSSSIATVAPNVNTTYTVAAELAGHCASTATVAVAVSPRPLVTINTPVSTICSGETAMLTASGNAINYVWYPDGGINNTAAVSPTATTIYVATGYNALGCAGTSSIQIDVNQSPLLQVTASKTLVCQRENVTLYANTDASSFVWSNSSTSLSTNVAPLSTTTYSISASNGICTSVASIVITTDACTAIEKQDAGAGISLYPNPANDAFTVAMPSGSDKITLQLYDVIGKLVVSQPLSQELTTVNVSNLQSGVYFFKISDNNNEIKTGKIVKQ